MKDLQKAWSIFAQEHFIKGKRQESLAAWKPNIKKEAVGQDFYTVLYIHEQKKKNDYVIKKQRSFFLHIS